MGDSNGVSVSTSWFSLTGPGMFVVVVLLVAAMIYNNIQTQDMVKTTQEEHRLIVKGLNEVFIGVVSPKPNLPPLVEEILTKKLQERAAEKAFAPPPKPPEGK